MNEIRKHIEEIKDALADRILAEQLDAAYVAYQDHSNITKLDADIRDALADYDSRMFPGETR